jgi:hypothetical protein
MKTTFTIHAEVDETPVRGNALASGDDAADREYEDEILARLRDDDVWAWACVEVRESGYFGDLCREAAEALDALAECEDAREDGCDDDRAFAYEIDAHEGDGAGARYLAGRS